MPVTKIHNFIAYRVKRYTVYTRIKSAMRIIEMCQSFSKSVLRISFINNIRSELENEEQDRNNNSFEFYIFVWIRNRLVDIHITIIIRTTLIIYKYKICFDLNELW